MGTIQAYLVFIALHFIALLQVLPFYKLKARAFTSQKITPGFPEVTGHRTRNLCELCLYCYPFLLRGESVGASVGGHMIFNFYTLT